MIANPQQALALSVAASLAVAASAQGAALLVRITPSEPWTERE